MFTFDFPIKQAELRISLFALFGLFIVGAAAAAFVVVVQTRNSVVIVNLVVDNCFVFVHPFSASSIERRVVEWWWTLTEATKEEEEKSNLIPNEEKCRQRRDKETIFCIQFNQIQRLRESKHLHKVNWRFGERERVRDFWMRRILNKDTLRLEFRWLLSFYRNAVEPNNFSSSSSSLIFQFTESHLLSGPFSFSLSTKTLVKLNSPQRNISFILNFGFWSHFLSIFEWNAAASPIKCA